MLFWFVTMATLMSGAWCEDDDLVKSTVREAQANEEVDFDELERRRPRTRRSPFPLTDIPAAGEFASTSAHLSSHPDLTWKVGDEVTILCRFSHKLAKKVNVTGMAGSLNSPINFGYYMQNFTFDHESYVASPNEDLTLDYTFTIADTLDAGEWQVSVTVFYEVGPLLYASTFFNQTVTLVQPNGGSGGLFSLVLLLGLASGLWFAKDKVLSSADQQQAPPADSAQARAARAEAIAAAQAAAQDDQSWTAHLDQQPKSRKPTKKSSKKK